MGKTKKKRATIVDVGGDEAVNQNGSGTGGEGGAETIYIAKMVHCRDGVQTISVCILSDRDGIGMLACKRTIQFTVIQVFIIIFQADQIAKRRTGFTACISSVNCVA